MELPEYLPDETSGDYRVRNNLPYVYTPFFPYPSYGRHTDVLTGPGTGQIDWQKELQDKFPTVILYPYESLQVSLSNESLFILFQNETQVHELARQWIVQHCLAYGKNHAEKVTPTVDELLSYYLSAKNIFRIDHP